MLASRTPKAKFKRLFYKLFFIFSHTSIFTVNSNLHIFKKAHHLMVMGSCQIIALLITQKTSVFWEIFQLFNTNRLEFIIS